jgi:S-adenosylmethionine:tRNA-ribosyltransferase-isomerase (queuine synthetase)
VSGTIQDYDYHLPQELIAQKPAEPRDHSRLLVYDRIDGSIRDDIFANIGRYLPENSALVVNNSRVERCRLLFHERKPSCL